MSDSEQLEKERWVDFLFSRITKSGSDWGKTQGNPGKMSIILLLHDTRNSDAEIQRFPKELYTLSPKDFEKTLKCLTSLRNFSRIGIFK